MNEEIKSLLRKAEEAIDQPPPPPPVKAEAQVTVRENGLEALIKIRPPKNGGPELTFVELKMFLVKNGILFGIDNNVLKSLSVCFYVSVYHLLQSHIGCFQPAQYI